VWTQGNIFGRCTRERIGRNLTPSEDFLPKEFGAWNAPPICIKRLSPSPDFEAKLMTRANFDKLVKDFINDTMKNWQAGQPLHEQEGVHNCHAEENQPAPARPQSLNNTSTQHQQESRGYETRQPSRRAPESRI
jgi:hypothetical protein